MTTVATHLTSAYIQLDERADDTSTVTRMQFWYNEARAVICERCGIRGLQVEGNVDFTEGQTSRPLALTSEHNAHSRITNVTKAWMIQYEYDTGTAAWVATSNYYPLEEITYEEYRDKWIGSQSTDTPGFFALFGTDSSGQPNCYLYPPPDSEDTTDATGKRYKVYFTGEADIGSIEFGTADVDILYPVGADHIYMAYLRYKQCEYDKDYVNRQMCKKDFDESLRNFLAREHAHSGTYVFGRPLGKQIDGMPNYVWPIVGP